ncbi:MAG: DUF1934 domain-containing protein [Lachnospiraceae bacterium]|nr:DUF1934 domain-containing protein [Lachnospiraceae bacterium]
MNKTDMHSEKNVKIAIMGKQTGPDNETLTSRVIAPGCFEEKNSSKEVTFTENPGQDDETETTIIYDKNKVQIIKKGATASHMIFEVGSTHMFKYETSFGTFMFGVLTKELYMIDEEDRTKIRLLYELLDNTGIISTNETVISIKF